MWINQAEMRQTSAKTAREAFIDHFTQYFANFAALIFLQKPFPKYFIICQPDTPNTNSLIYPPSARKYLQTGKSLKRLRKASASVKETSLSYFMKVRQAPMECPVSIM
jgi:hypothetical protein